MNGRFCSHIDSYSSNAYWLDYQNENSAKITVKFFCYQKQLNAITKFHQGYSWILPFQAEIFPVPKREDIEPNPKSSGNASRAWRILRTGLVCVYMPRGVG